MASFNILIQHTHPNEWYGQISLDNDIVFAITAPDQHTVCQFIAMHKACIDSRLQIVLEEVEIEPESKEVH